MAKKSDPRKQAPDANDELEDLKDFIQRKKVQNKALKKIIEKLNKPDKTETN